MIRVEREKLPIGGRWYWTLKTSGYYDCGWSPTKVTAYVGAAVVFADYRWKRFVLLGLRSLYLALYRSWGNVLSNTERLIKW